MLIKLQKKENIFEKFVEMDNFLKRYNLPKLILLGTENTLTDQFM
jgi:hypothetical protein